MPAYDDEAKEAAVKLLADRAFAEKVKRLPALTRFPGFIWLIFAGFLLPQTRRVAEQPEC